MVIAYLGLGSNLGDKKKNLNRAIRHLKQLPRLYLHRISRFYRTRPMYVVHQPYFLNAAVKVETSIDPEDLLVAIKTIEKKIERRSRTRYGPRIIDIDLLLYGKKCMHTSWLQIPHKRMHERPFVLKPLNEIAPNSIHPVFKKSIKTLMNNCRIDIQ